MAAKQLLLTGMILRVLHHRLWILALRQFRLRRCRKVWIFLSQTWCRKVMPGLCPKVSPCHQSLTKKTQIVFNTSYLRNSYEIPSFAKPSLFSCFAGFPCFWEAVSNRPKIAGASTMHIQPKVSWPTIERHFAMLHHWKLFTVRMADPPPEGSCETKLTQTSQKKESPTNSKKHACKGSPESHKPSGGYPRRAFRQLNWLKFFLVHFASLLNVQAAETNHEPGTVRHFQLLP